MDGPPGEASPPKANVNVNVNVKVKVAAADGWPADIPIISGFTCERELARGGMGVVLRVRDAGGRPLALKIMRPEMAHVARATPTFLREADVALQLRHPNIVETYELGEVGGVPYFTMELCEAGSVEDLMEKRGGRLSLEEAGPLMMQALTGLDYAHTVEVESKLADGSRQRFRGVVHRDLKPGNLLLMPMGSRLVVKLADYGLAKAFAASGMSGHTQTGEILGTPGFMPREQLVNTKRMTPISDVWSIAATFYAMLTGCEPRDFPNGVTWTSVVLNGTIVPMRDRAADVPERIATVIEKGLSVASKSRYQTARELADALGSAL
jgi:serine/threonine-protein kinase